MSLFSAGSSNTKSKTKFVSEHQRDALSMLMAHLTDYSKAGGSSGNISGIAQGVSDAFSGLLEGAASGMSDIAGGSSTPTFDNSFSDLLTRRASGLVTSGQTDATYSKAANTLSGLTDWQGQAQRQLSSLQSGLTSMWSKDILPTLTSSAVSSGGFGGGRAGVAQGTAFGQIADTYAESAGDIFASARTAATNAANGLTSLASARDSSTASFASLLGSLASSLDARGVNQATAKNNATAHRISAAGQLGSLSGTALTNALSPITSVLQAFESYRNGIGNLAYGNYATGKQSNYSIGTGS